MSNTPATTELRLPAIAVSRGIGIGPVSLIRIERGSLAPVNLEESQVESEIARFRQAVELCVSELRDIAGNSPDSDRPIAEIFGSHLLMVEDASFVDAVAARIKADRRNAEWATRAVTTEFVDRQNALADQAFREKSLDIEDVAERILLALNGPNEGPARDFSGAVVVARELRPSVLMEIGKSGPAAIITERGGWTSHASILARELKIPMTTGLKNPLALFADADPVIVDGNFGEVIVHPTRDTIKQYRRSDLTRHKNGRRANAEKDLVTRDGVPITIRANTDGVAGLLYAQSHGAKGIGLFRSESLISHSAAVPDEEEQVSIYREIGRAAGADRVRIRTFDIDAHHLGDFHSSESNPALGMRSIRYSLTDTEIFRTQIRAILRASHDAAVDLVLPMISGVGEIARSRTIIDEERQRLIDRGVAVGKPRLGAMIEVPSAVLTAATIATKVDFLCLGTNDLVQYLLAVDRDNQAIADWYQTLHPAVLRAVSTVIEAAGNQKKPLVTCGEMAGSPFYVPLLIGLGARELSMNVNSIAQVRHLIEGMTLDEAQRLVDHIAASETAEQSEEILRRQFLNKMPQLFPPGLLESKHR